MNSDKSIQPKYQMVSKESQPATGLQGEEPVPISHTVSGDEATQDLGPYSHIQNGSLRGMNAQAPLRRTGVRQSTLIGSEYGARSRVDSRPKSQSAVAASVASVSLTERTASTQLHNSSSTNELKKMFNVDPKGNFTLYTMDPEDDDYLHDPNDRKHDREFAFCSKRGVVNMTVLSILIAGILGLFAGYPVISHFKSTRASKLGAYNIGGTNGTGQVPVVLPQMHLRDPDTPKSAYRWTSPIDNAPYHLVFSDEFEAEGRTFWPNDDPFWEAQNIWYGATGDYEWYSPEQVNTTNGALQITLEAKPINNLNFRSGMLTSWNKFCFQGGYLEFSATLPGTPQQVGWWPGLWTMGNLARPGYLGTTDGMWPYSYDGCDSGILANQTAPGRPGYSDVSTFQQHGQTGLSWLSGMRTPSCTCAGEDHPGPSHDVARSAPEMDVLEAQIGHRSVGEASQSLQIAPFDPEYEIDQSGTTLYDPDNTFYNSYKGGKYQEAASAVSRIPDKAYALTDNTFTTFGVDYRPDFAKRGRGTMTWFVDGKATWTLTDAAMPARPEIDIKQRHMPLEPMAIIMNLGISRGFQADLDFDTLTYPAVLRIDYVRLYQSDSYEKELTSCDPPDHPTSQYIQDHIDVYTNPNHTMWPKTFPRNRLTGC